MARKDPRRALEQGDLGTEALKELRELEADVPAADDDERPRLVEELDRLVRREKVARQVGDVLQAGDVGGRRAAAGRDEHLLAAQRVTIHLDGVRINERGVTVNDRDRVAVREDRLVLLRAVAVDDLVLPLDQRPEVEVEGLAAEAWKSRVLRLPVDPSRLDEVLRRQAAAVDTRPSDRSGLGHHRGPAEVGGSEGGSERRRAGSQDDEVVAIDHVPSFPSRDSSRARTIRPRPRTSHHPAANRPVRVRAAPTAHHPTAASVAPAPVATTAAIRIGPPQHNAVIAPPMRTALTRPRSGLAGGSSFVSPKITVVLNFLDRSPTVAP